MLTAATSAAGTSPHEMMDIHLREGMGPARRFTASQLPSSQEHQDEMEKAHEHMRAAQWAFAHVSMVVTSDEWDDDDDQDWNDWDEDETAAARDPSTPDWRGVKIAC
jgi:hypothetical protein